MNNFADMTIRACNAVALMDNCTDESTIGQIGVYCRRPSFTARGLHGDDDGSGKKTKRR
jgi:hypothetical protein